MNIVVCLKQVPDTTVVKIDPVKGTLIREGVPSIINPEDKHALEAAFYMNIVVCLKQVPDTTVVKIDPVKGTLIREGVPSIINPEDKHALEAALQIKEKNGAHITVISMGPPQAKEALREALCMGADEAILLTDRAFGGADTLATSKTLAAAIKTLDYDIIFGGRQAIDGDTAQVGPEIAEHLEIPQVTYVQDVEFDGNDLIVNRALEDGYELIKVQTPCLLTAIEELNHPRYMNARLIFDTANKEVKVMTSADLDVEANEIGLNGSPTKVKKSMTKEAKGAGEIVKDSVPEAVSYVLSKLKEKHYI